MAIQADGRIVISGIFSTLGGQSCQNLGRLNSFGGVDFTSHQGNSGRCLLIQADGRIVVGGSFSQLAGQVCTNLGRLNADGSFDATFNAQVDGYVICLAAQADGKFLVGGGEPGSFTSVGGHPVNHLARLTSDGALDTSFNPAQSGLIAEISCLAVQSDGKILVGGQPAGPTHVATNLVRLNADGGLDVDFQPVVTTNSSLPAVYSLAIQADGKILVGGNFSGLCGRVRANLGRVNPDGTLDDTFNPGSGDAVSVLGLQANGRILAGTLSGYLDSFYPNGTGDGYPVTCAPPHSTPPKRCPRWTVWRCNLTAKSSLVAFLVQLTANCMKVSQG